METGLDIVLREDRDLRYRVPASAQKLEEYLSSRDPPLRLIKRRENLYHIPKEDTKKLEEESEEEEPLFDLS